MKRKIFNFAKILPWVFVVVFLFFTKINYAEDVVIWGMQSGEGDFDGGLNGWTIGGDNNYFWQYDPTSNVGEALSAQEDILIESPSVNNGAAEFNADFYNTGGENPCNPCQSFYAELISPVIDLSGTDNYLALSFYQLVRIYEDNTAISISYDGGETWETPVFINTSLNQKDVVNSEMTFRLPCDFTGISQARVKFIFSGRLFYWMIDDVRIIERNEFDLHLDDTFYALPPNMQTPKSQQTPFPLMVDLENIGQYEMENVELVSNIRHLSTMDIAFTDTLFFDEIPPCQLVQDSVFSLLASLPEEKASYSLRYKVDGIPNDDAIADNKIFFEFRVSDTVFAKELNGPTRSIKPALFKKYSYGNCFYIQNGDGWYASKVTFGIDEPADIAGESVFAKLYKWTGNFNNAGYIPEDQIELVCLNEYNIPVDAEEELITMPVSYENPEIALEQSWYIIAISYNGNKNVYIQANDEYDYTGAYIAGLKAGISQYSTALWVGNQNGNPNFHIGGFGFDIVPVIRLHITDNPVSVNEIPDYFTSLEIFPNPVVDDVFLSFSLKEINDEISVNLLDVKGKQLTSKSYYKIRKIQNASFEMKNYPPGVYYFQFVSGKNVYSKKVIKI